MDDKEREKLRAAWRKRIAEFQESQTETFSVDRQQGVEDLIDDIINQRTGRR